MKKLTHNQLRELKVHNAVEFCRKWWFLSYTQYSRQTLGSFGWWVVTPSMRNPERQTFVSQQHWKVSTWGLGSDGNGNAHPDTLRAVVEPVLQQIKPGIKWPEKWVKFLGEWMDKAYYDRRMAELVAQYKELKAQKKLHHES